MKAYDFMCAALAPVRQQHADLFTPRTETILLFSSAAHLDEMHRPKMAFSNKYPSPMTSHQHTTRNSHTVTLASVLTDLHFQSITAAATTVLISPQLCDCCLQRCGLILLAIHSGMS